MPLYQTAAYNFSDAADGASKFAWSKDGYVYTRMGNPTNAVFEQRMSMLEGGVGAVATASGHAAQVRFYSPYPSASLFSLLRIHTVFYQEQKS